MRFFFRLASLAALMLAIAAGTVDSIQSVAASQLVLTPLGDTWQDVAPASLAALRSMLSYYIHPKFDAVAAGWLLQLPAFAIFLILSLVLWMAGYKKPAPAGRFAA